MIQTINGHTYTKRWAYWPTRTGKGELVWMEYYYMRPGRDGTGVILSHDDFILECSGN